MKKQIIGLTLAVLALVSVAASAARADLQQIVTETQRMDQAPGSLRLIWWIPTDYWRESFKKSTMSPAQADAICKSLDEYLVVAVADLNIGPMGGVTPVPRDQILNKLSIKLSNGDALKPLDPSDLSPDVRNFLAVIKPMMTNMLGQFGSGLEFICFPAKNASGDRQIDPRKPGMLQIVYGEKTFRFRLPLGSLLPPKYDPQTGEKFLGNYIYSPFTGVKLVDTPPSNP